MNYDQLIFSELRLIAVSPSTAELTEARMLKAVTANEELLALGYTLSARDIAVLAVSADVDTFVSRVREYIGDVKADPMYPDFPRQVMAMPEAQFRFHQMLHYFSTYDFELLTGFTVIRGWLPNMQSTEKTKADDKLLSARTVALIPEKDKYTAPYKKILTRTERMDVKQRLIIGECIKHLTPEELTGVKVTFKQNLLEIFNAVFISPDLTNEQKLDCLHKLCQHTGDVWKCMDYALTRAKFHFRTSQKRLIVKLLESYPEADFKANLILTNKKSERTLLMLKFLDYNEYSRSEAHKKAVADLRGGELSSWESRAKYLVSQKHPETLEYYTQRPGIMLRHITYLLRNGYKLEDIYAKLHPHAAELKTQTLVSLANHFERPMEAWTESQRFEEALGVSIMNRSLLLSRLAANDTPLKGKKVYVSMPDFDLGLSTIRVGDKSDEGGYIRSGLAYRIPAEVNRIRFFVYWNDEKRVDIDLHAHAVNCDGSVSNIGWNANFKDSTLVFSGDITHSDAAEYIDIDFVKGRSLLKAVTANINIFAGPPTFGEIGECFVGAMAVSNMGEDIKLYDPKNCFFTHYLKSKCRFMNYGYVDVQNRVIVFDGIPGRESGNYYSEAVRNRSFTLNEYLQILFRAQNSVIVTDPKNADLTLVMGKPSNDGEISLIDNNFFME